MKYLISFLFVAAAGFGSQAEASNLRSAVEFTKIRCGFFGSLKVNIRGERRTVKVSKNGLKCKNALAQLKAEIDRQGNRFEADVYMTSERKRECDRDDDGFRRCEVHRTTYRVYEIPNLKINTMGFYGRAFVKKQRIR